MHARVPTPVPIVGAGHNGIWARWVMSTIWMKTMEIAQMVSMEIRWLSSTRAGGLCWPSRRSSSSRTVLELGID